MTLGERDAEREALLDWLRSHGATEEQLAEPKHPYNLVADLALARGDKLSARDIADRLGEGPEKIMDVFRAYGVAVPDADAVLFTGADAEFVSVEKGTAPDISGDASEGRVLARVVANALDRVAEACVAYYVQGKEDELWRTRADLVTLAETTTGAIESAEQLGHGLSLLFRHHLRQAIERQRVSQVRVASRDLARVAVGFVDLVGSTALEEGLDPAELRALVSQFEARAFEVAADHGGRVVKFIGDEIMVVGLDPTSACHMMVGLLHECGVGDVRPRGGLSYGEVLFRGGDYYGREVNLAARLVEEAIPGEILVGKSVVDSVSVPGTGVAGHEDGESPLDVGSLGAPEFDPAGRRLLKGFTEPVPVWSITLPDS